MEYITNYLLRTMQLSCLLIGVFTALISLRALLDREALVVYPRKGLALSALFLGSSVAFTFSPRLSDYSLHFFNSDMVVTNFTSLSAMSLFFVANLTFSSLSQHPRRSLLLYLLMLSASALTTYLEMFQ